MKFEEIKRLMPIFRSWKLNILLVYGSKYAEKYCTWERFKDHIEILEEINNEKHPGGDLIPESLKAEIMAKAEESFFGG